MAAPDDVRKQRIDQYKKLGRSILKVANTVAKEATRTVEVTDDEMAISFIEAVNANTRALQANTKMMLEMISAVDANTEAMLEEEDDDDE